MGNKKLPDPMMVCKDAATEQLKLTRNIESSIVQTWSFLIENHPLSIMAKWMTETYIEIALNSNNSPMTNK